MKLLYYRLYLVVALGLLWLLEVLVGITLDLAPYEIPGIF